MDVDPQPGPSSTKRPANVLVDPDDGTEISSAKKLRLSPDVAKKRRCLQFLVAAYVAIHQKWFKKVDPDMRHIEVSAQITNLIFSAFTIRRQEANNSGGSTKAKALAKKFYDSTIDATKIAVPVAELLTLITESATKCGLQFKNYSSADKENWYGTVLPYLDFFLGFKLRMNELRLGHSTMPIRKEANGASTSFPVIKYGLNGSHHVLLEGCSYPPEKRGSMAQSIGPMTALLCHIKARDETYRRKWTDAAKRSMAHVPMIDEILEAVKGKTAAELSSLISTLADILLITTSRQAQRMCFPLLFVVRIYSSPVDDDDHILDTEGEPTGWMGGDTFLDRFNVSGVGGFYTYALSCLQKWLMPATFTSQTAAQIIFHSIFGTFKEDLSILEQITNQATWLRREEMGAEFKGMNTKMSANTEVELIKLNYYSKLTSANQTGLLASSYLQTCAVPVFSGKRRQNFIDDFFEQINKRVGVTSSGKSIAQLTNALSTILDELRKLLAQNNNSLEMGTTDWFNMSDINLESGGSKANIILTGRGHFFLGRKWN